MNLLALTAPDDPSNNNKGKQTPTFEDDRRMVDNLKEKLGVSLKELARMYCDTNEYAYANKCIENFSKEISHFKHGDGGDSFRDRVRAALRRVEQRHLSLKRPRMEPSDAPKYDQDELNRARAALAITSGFRHVCMQDPMTFDVRKSGKTIGRFATEDDAVVFAYREAKVDEEAETETEDDQHEAGDVAPTQPEARPEARPEAQKPKAEAEARKAKAEEEARKAKAEAEAEAKANLERTGPAVEAARQAQPAPPQDPEPIPEPESSPSSEEDVNDVNSDSHSSSSRSPPLPIAEDLMKYLTPAELAKLQDLSRTAKKRKRDADAEAQRQAAKAELERRRAQEAEAAQARNNFLQTVEQRVREYYDIMKQLQKLYKSIVVLGAQRSTAAITDPDEILAAATAMSDISLAEMRSMLHTQGGGARQTVERLRELIHAPKFKHDCSSPLWAPGKMQHRYGELPEIIENAPTKKVVLWNCAEFQRKLNASDNEREQWIASVDSDVEIRYVDRDDGRGIKGQRGVFAKRDLPPNWISPVVCSVCTVKDYDKQIKALPPVEEVVSEAFAYEHTLKFRGHYLVSNLRGGGDLHGECPTGNLYALINSPKGGKDPQGQPLIANCTFVEELGPRGVPHLAIKAKAPIRKGDELLLHYGKVGAGGIGGGWAQVAMKSQQIFAQHDEKN